jgi:hypothetical protein
MPRCEVEKEVRGVQIAVGGFAARDGRTRRWKSDCHTRLRAAALYATLVCASTHQSSLDSRVKLNWYFRTHRYPAAVYSQIQFGCKADCHRPLPRRYPRAAALSPSTPAVRLSISRFILGGSHAHLAIVTQVISVPSLVRWG